MRLLAKFTLMFVLVFSIGLSAAAYIFYRVLQRNAREQVLYNAQMLTDTALAIRNYTDQEVGPAINSALGQQRAQARLSPTDDVFRELCAKKGFIGKQVFYPQTIPAHSASSLFNELRKKYPDYYYKEAAPNPTNPGNRAVDWEEDVLKEFRNHPDLKVFRGERDTPSGRSLFIARPLFAQKSCLQCHSTPSAAPPEMVQLYGPANGFGWKEGEMVAARIVSVPLSLPVEMADRAFKQLLLSLVLVCVATLVLMNVLLYVTVVRPVSIFAVRADDISKGQLDVPELPVRGRDEIATLAAAFNRMHRSVTAAMQMLEVAEEAPEPATISRTKSSRGSTAP